MSHNEEFTNNKSKLVISTVALLFCLVWVLVGEADIMIVAVSIAFYAFLKYAVATEISYIEGNDSH